MKKFSKRIIPMLVAMAMSCSSSVVAFAAETSNDAVTPTSEYDVTLSSNDGGTTRAGEEYWDYTAYYSEYVGSFSMTGSNMTKTKTLSSDSAARYLTIRADYNCSSSSKLKVEIVDANNSSVLASATSSASTNGSTVVQAWVAELAPSKKVKIRFIIQDANGNYAPSRTCNVSYSYSLSAWQ